MNILKSINTYCLLRAFSGFTFLLTGCQDYGEQQAQKLETVRQQPPTYRVITIEGCEYLRFEVTHGYAVLTHKGNCRNPIHCNRDTTAQAGR